MLNIKIDNKQESAVASGDLDKVAAEIALAINIIFRALQSKDNECAELFKKYIQRLMEDDTPTWRQNLKSGSAYFVDVDNKE